MWVRGLAASCRRRQATLIPKLLGGDMNLSKYTWIMPAGIFSVLSFTPDIALGQGAQFVPCPAPIAHCVSSVSGWCEKEPNGKIMIIFYDKSYSGERYRQCLNQVLATRSQQKQKAAPKRQQ